MGTAGDRLNCFDLVCCAAYYLRTFGFDGFSLLVRGLWDLIFSNTSVLFGIIKISSTQTQQKIIRISNDS